jgi:O-methyltransferase
VTPAPVRRFLSRLGLYRLDHRLKQRLGITKRWLSHPPYPPTIARQVRSSVDIVRYGAVALALHRLEEEGIPGDLAEVGVYRGELSRFLREVAPDRPLHLFDTFSGFVPWDADRPDQEDHRFRDTSVEGVRQFLGPRAEGAVFHPGFFPDTASNLGVERFAFVMVDLDRYRPTLAALQVFYPRLSAGGYMFLHDFNSPESDRGVSRAAAEFLANRPERLIELPDPGGSALFRKLS